jgi:hypothetical protein
MRGLSSRRLGADSPGRRFGWGDLPRFVTYDAPGWTTILVRAGGVLFEETPGTPVMSVARPKYPEIREEDGKVSADAPARPSQPTTTKKAPILDGPLPKLSEEAILPGQSPSLRIRPRTVQVTLPQVRAVCFSDQDPCRNLAVSHRPTYLPAGRVPVAVPKHPRFGMGVIRQR